MFERIAYCLLIASCVSLASVPCASASDRAARHRDQTIEERLSCFSSHASSQGIDWDEVCSDVTKNVSKEPQTIEDPVSLDAMIERLHAAADEMLEQSIDDEVPAVSVDEVYEKHSVVFDAKRSVDDVAIEQGVKNDFTAEEETEMADVPKKVLGVETSGNKAFVKDDPGLLDDPFLRDTARDTTMVQLRTHTFDVGYEKYYYEYKEDSVQVKLKGWWDTVSAAYIYRPKPGDLLDFAWLNHYRLEGRYGFADLDYSSGSTGTSNDDPNYMYETRALVGRDFYPYDRSVITPYVGFGFRYLVDDSGGKQTTTGHYGYDRTSHYYYLPIGVDYTYQLNEGWRVVGNGEFDVFLYGWQKSYLSDVPAPGYFDLRNRQDSGYGVRGSVKLIKTTPLIDFSIEPFVRFWHIDDSDVGNAGSVNGLEPENTTLETGVRAGAQF